LGLLFPIYGKIKHVPNHQPGMIWRFLTIRHGHPWRLDENWESPWLRKPQMVQVFDKRFRCRTPPVGISHLHQRYSARVGVLDTCSRGAMNTDFGTVESQVHWWRALELLLYHLKYSIACYFQLGAESQDTKHIGEGNEYAAPPLLIFG